MTTPWQPPATSSSRNLVIALVGIVAGLVVLAGAAVFVVVSLGSREGARQVAAPVASANQGLGGPGAGAAPGGPSESAGPGTVPGPSAGPTASAAAGEPPLRKVPALTVVGPSFATADKTYTMGFKGWPFAFRVPGSWGCLKGKTKRADEQAWVCIDEGNPGAKQRVAVMVRPCPSGCPAQEQRSRVADWFDQGRTPAKGKPDARTSHTELTLANGLYGLLVCRFFADKPGVALNWQVAVYATSPKPTKGAVQKVANDIVSQTP